jgi:membrane protease YdiL (CAAX protease family)
VARFALLTLGISLALSLIASPFITTLSWWKVFRRCVSIGAAVALWLCIKGFERRSFRSYGFPVGRAGKRQMLTGLLIGICVLGLALAAGLLSGTCRIELTPDRAKLWRVLLTFLPAAGLVGLLEELVFRGYLLQQLLACSTKLAVCVSSALYALVHLRNQTMTAATTRELVGLFVLGAVLSLACLRTRQLSLAVGLHAALAYGARVNKLLIEFTDPSLSWLTGTSRLIDGVASWIMLCGMGAAIAWWTQSWQPEGRGA